MASRWTSSRPSVAEALACLETPSEPEELRELHLSQATTREWASSVRQVHIR